MNRREILRYAAYATGVAVSAPLASAFLVGCKRDAEVAAGTAVYEPKFFTAEEFEFINKFADTVIPRTDTPGATDVGATEMIDKVLADVYSKEAQDETRAGLSALMKKMDADNVDHGSFSQLSDDGRLEYLQGQDLYYKNPDKDWDAEAEDEQSLREAYFGLKQAVIANYFGSEEVATTQLAYLPVPGEYVPCGDLQELTGGVAWAI